MSKKKKENKPEKIVITIVGLDGTPDHVEINSANLFYNTAYTAGNYTLTVRGANKAWESLIKIYKIVRDSEQEVKKLINKPIKKVTKSKSKPKSKPKSKKK